MESAQPGAILTTADGAPLKQSLGRALRREKTVSLLLVAPLFLFIVVTFLIPIADMLLRGVDNKIVSEQIPHAVALLAEWDGGGGELPGEAVFSAMVADLQKGAKAKTINRLGKRLNYEKSGMSSLFRKSARRVLRLKEGPYREALVKIDRRWGDIQTWQLIKTFSPPYTGGYFLTAVDMRLDPAEGIVRQQEDRRIYLNLFGRTLWLSALITLLTLLLGYPIAYLLATLPTRTSNLLIILVLLPFWTSLLVRTTSWIALLQQEGVINDVLVAVGILDNDSRLAMIHNRIGTVVAMTHILLPFMVLPLYSVMKTIPPSYMRAAVSLGAHPALAFLRIYVPNTVPGMGAGGILVFILAIGYYITPALVGGSSGTFISNFIANHISSTLNWGLAAALGMLLLAIVLALYLLYDRIVGIDNMKLG
ncbi:MAG: ABC transporter permease [Gammaproteobacteria bacterium]|nr:ABC transporter permease [Gammaproteobacteria bacterium]